MNDTPAGQSTAQRGASHVATGDSLGVTYRLLNAGEEIQAGDQFLDRDCETWISLPIDGGNAVWQCWMIGCPWNPEMMVPHRRASSPNNRDVPTSGTNGETTK